MGLQIVKTIVANGVTVFQDIDETAQGGFTLITTNLVIGDTLPAGTPMYYDEATRTAKPLKTAEFYAGATNVAVVYQFKKGHKFVIGDIITASIGGVAHTITAIDTSNANYDSVTIDVTLGVTFVAGDTVFHSLAAGAAAGAYYVTPKGLLFQTYDVALNNNVAIVINGRVYARRAPKMNAAIQALMPNIIFSQSF